jgi:predicted DsbA family dithiol-disulfide isomerase
VASARAAWLERRFGARIRWLPFDLHPEYPPGGITPEQLSARYGHPDILGETGRRIEAAGLPFTRAEVISNSAKALNLTELARDLGKDPEVHQALFDAYWAQGRDIGFDEVLVSIAQEAGIPEDQALSAITELPYVERIRSSTDTAFELGVSGVPAWVIDDRFMVPGAQPEEVFERILSRLGYEPHN